MSKYLLSFFIAFNSFALTVDEALKIWENAYNQGYNDAVQERLNVRPVLKAGYYIAVPATNTPKYLLGLLKFNAKKLFPVNYVGVKKGNVLLLFYTNNLNDAEYMKNTFDKKLRPVLDRFNLNLYIFDLKMAP